MSVTFTVIQVTVIRNQKPESTFMANNYKQCGAQVAKLFSEQVKLAVRFAVSNGFINVQMKCCCQL